LPRKKVADGEDNGSLNGRRVQFQLSAEVTTKIIATNIERISHGEIPVTAVNSVFSYRRGYERIPRASYR
jgi:hypothetical protein